jgi:hypothetical protein
VRMAIRKSGHGEKGNRMVVKLMSTESGHMYIT